MVTPKNRMKSSEPQAVRGQRMRETAEEAASGASHMVQEYPGSSALVTFSIGCLLGMTTAWLLMPARRERHWYDMSRPDWASSRGFSRAVEAVENVPRTVSRYFAR
jgi:hypothetical protein